MELSFGKGLKYLFDQNYRFIIDANKGKYNNMADEEFIRREFRARMGYELDLDNPKTLNEKLQWLKLYDRKEIYTTIVDKYAAKEFAGGIIGQEHIIPTLCVWDKAEDIDFYSLPDQFVLKCTHDSHRVVICKDKAKLDFEKTRTMLASALSRDYYLKYREWPYKNVKRRILAEKYLEDETGNLPDYKFYCFNGKVDCVLTCFDRETGNTKFFFFDRNWELKRYNKQGQAAPEGFTKPKPEGIDKMFDLAEALGKASQAPFVRVDFYNVSGKIYFGELTLYPSAGYDTGRLKETDVLFGSKVDLSLVKKQG